MSSLAEARKAGQTQTPVHHFDRPAHGAFNHPHSTLVSNHLSTDEEAFCHHHPLISHGTSTVLMRWVHPSNTQQQAVAVLSCGICCLAFDSVMASSPCNCKLANISPGVEMVRAIATYSLPKLGLPSCWEVPPPPPPTTSLPGCLPSCCQQFTLNNCVLFSVSDSICSWVSSESVAIAERPSGHMEIYRHQ